MSIFKCCAFHRGVESIDKSNDSCMKCSMNYYVSKKVCGTPSKIWMERRELYKSVSICDMPSTIIPEKVSPHLKSDIERFLYKQARRAVQICLDSNSWDNDYENPKELKKQLDNLTSNKTRAINMKENLDYLDQILWNACMSLDIQYEIGDMMLNMQDIDKSLRYFEQERKQHLEQIEAIKTDPSSVEIKGKKGKRYMINYELNVCTCPSYMYSSAPLFATCKHLQKRQKHKKSN